MILAQFPCSVSLGPDITVCLEASFKLIPQESTPSISYNWAGGLGLNCYDCQTPLFTATDTGTFIYVLTVAQDSCTSSDTISITVLPGKSPQYAIAPSRSLCEGDTMRIGGPPFPNTAYSWSSDPPGFVSTEANPIIVVSDSRRYYLTVTSPSCPIPVIDSVYIDILFHKPIYAPAEDTINLCRGQEIDLGIASVDWSGSFTWAPSDGLNIIQNGQRAIAIPAQSVRYTLVASTLQGECQWEKVYYLPVDSLPADAIVVPKDTSICPGNTVLLRVSSLDSASFLGLAFSWTRAPMTTVLSTDTLPQLLVRPEETTTYHLVISKGACRDTATAVVKLIPPAPLQLPPADLTVCFGDTISLNGVFDPNATYIWTSTHPGFGVSNAPSPVFAPTQTATYYVTADNGCPRSDSVRIFVRRAMLEVSNDTTICKGQSVRLIALTDTPGSQFEWVRLSDGQVLSTAQSVLVSPSTTTAYVITLTYGQNCKRRDTVQVQVEGEDLSVLFPSDPRVCMGGQIPLNLAPSVPGATYTWAASPPDPTLMTQEPNPQVSPTQNTTYTVTITDGQCTVLQSFGVMVLSATLKVTGDTAICAGDRTVLSAIGTGPNGRYLWSTGETTNIIAPSPDTSTAFVVTFLYGDTCALRDTVYVTTVPAFSLSIASVPDTNQINLGQSLQLFANVSPPQNLNGFSFTWQETIIDTKTLATNVPNIEVSPSSNDTASSAIRYTLRAVSPQGCIRTAERVFRLLFPLVRFPSAFTPNGDGHNDFFEMLVLEGRAQIELMQIFNRWGQPIFESSAPDARWDGTVNGQPAPSDVYLYRVVWRRSDGAMMPIAAGDVTLMR